MKERRQLLVLTTTFPRWAGDHEPGFVYELSKRLADHFDVTVIAPHAPGAQTLEMMAGMTIHRFRYAPERLETLAYDGGIGSNLKRFRWKYLLLQGFLLSFFFSALRIVRREGIDAVHAHWMVPGGLVGAALKMLFPTLRVVTTAHGADVFQLKGKVFRSLRNWVASEVDTVTVVGNGIADQAQQEGWFSDKIAIAPMGVDLQNTFVAKPRQHQDPSLIFAGRLVEKKGVAHLINAMPLIRAKVPAIRLVVAGFGPLQHQLEQRVDQLALRDVVHFTGQYNSVELASLFNQSDIAVLPFIHAEDGDVEGFGLTTVEAMGCGLPVVVGDVPAAHDIVVDGHNGILVQGDDHAALAESVVRLISDVSFAKALSSRARADVLQRFDWSVATKNYAQILSTNI